LNFRNHVTLKVIGIRKYQRISLFDVFPGMQVEQGFYIRFIRVFHFCMQMHFPYYTFRKLFIFHVIVLKNITLKIWMRLFIKTHRSSSVKVPNAKKLGNQLTIIYCYLLLSNFKLQFIYTINVLTVSINTLVTWVYDVLFYNLYLNIFFSKCLIKLESKWNYLVKFYFVRKTYRVLNKYWLILRYYF
jgi:hypothetical protein